MTTLSPFKLNYDAISKFHASYIKFTDLCVKTYQILRALLTVTSLKHRHRVGLLEQA